MSSETAELTLPVMCCREANIPFNEDASRGYDHGTFVPLMIAYPLADIPIVQVRVNAGVSRCDTDAQDIIQKHLVFTFTEKC